MLRGHRISPSRHNDRTTSGGAADCRLHVRMQCQGKQGGLHVRAHSKANAQRLEDEARIELRHAAHGCPVAVDADLTCN